MRSVISGTAIILLLVSLFTFAVNIQRVRAGGTIYIRADGSIDPPTANITTADNTTYTFLADIHESIVIEKDDITVDGSGYTLIGSITNITGFDISYRNNVTVKNTKITESLEGFFVYHSNNCRILDNVITSYFFASGDGHVSNYTVSVVIVHSINTIVQNNIMKSNYAQGIYVSYSTNSSITKNNITDNMKGIYLAYSYYNHIYENKMENNSQGVELYWSSNNNISRNKIKGGDQSTCVEGLTIRWSSNNTISNNYISDHRYPSWIVLSSGNRIYHNNFVNNLFGPQPWNVLSSTIWDNGCEGNYWSNYNGTDLDGDGIGDTYLPWGKADSYPLMNPYWNPGDVNHDLQINIFDAVTIATSYGSTPSDPRWNCHSDITEPYGVIDIFDVALMAGSYGQIYEP